MVPQSGTAMVTIETTDIEIALSQSLLKVTMAVALLKRDSDKESWEVNSSSQPSTF